MKWLPLLLASLCVVHGEEISFEKPAMVVEKAFPIGNGELRARVKGRTGVEPMAILMKGGKRPATTSVPGAAFLGPAWFHFSLDWLAGDSKVTDYKRVLNLEDGTVVTTFNRGGAGFTWTVFASSADDLIVTHLRTDKPGALNFRLKLPTENSGKAHVEDRRMLILKGSLGGAKGKPFEARAWVYPMESEVTPGNGEITVRGEGEALILLAASTDPEKIKTLPDRMKPLGFGGEDHPDVFQVWNGLLDRHVAAHRKSMEGAGEGKSKRLSRYLKTAIAKPEEGVQMPPEPEGPVEMIPVPDLDPDEMVDPDLLPKKQ